MLQITRDKTTNYCCQTVNSALCTCCSESRTYSLEAIRIVKQLILDNNWFNGDISMIRRLWTASWGIAIPALPGLDAIEN
jgi:hypothetical protein